MREDAREMICISCPIGCRLTVGVDAGGDVTVTGNRCPRGVEYGREELLAPKRVVTATVALKEGQIGRVPLKTDAPLLKQHIPGLLNEIYAMELQAPLSKGDVVIRDIRGTGVRLLVTRSVGKAG